LCRRILLVDRSTTEEINTVSEPALEQQKQNHLRPCSRRLTAEEEKKRVRKPESNRNNKSCFTHLLRDF
jgi:hypothetical protein